MWREALVCLAPVPGEDRVEPLAQAGENRKQGHESPPTWPLTTPDYVAGPAHPLSEVLHTRTAIRRERRRGTQMPTKGATPAAMSGRNLGKMGRDYGLVGAAPVADRSHARRRRRREKISRLHHRQIAAERVVWSPRAAAGRAIVTRDAVIDLVTKTAYFALATGVVVFVAMFLLTLTHS